MNEEKPPRRQPRLQAAPKIGHLYWCDFPKDAQLPELWKQRPVIILSYKNTLHGCVTVVPCTTLPPDSKNTHSTKWMVPLQTTINGSEGWAICDKITTVAVSRLTQHKGSSKKLPNDEFNMVLARVLDWLPKPQFTEKP